jgi:N-acetylglucosamine-6-phosphate deacetylase
MKTLLKDVHLFLPDKTIDCGFLLINDGIIEKLGYSKDCPVIDKPYKLIQLSPDQAVIPGFIDLHIHGSSGADTMDATEEALQTIAAAMPKEGTTSFLATTMTTHKSDIQKALENAAAYVAQHNHPGKAEVLGIHLEGPFISPKRIGAQHPDFVVSPSIDQFKEWQSSANGNIKLVTIAPEQPGGMELVRFLTDEGVVSSIGHSDATYEQVVQAIEAGLTHATHLYNGMRPLHHREPGVVGAVFLHDEIKSEIIVDGVHSRPEMVRLAYRNKGKEGLILITDAMRAQCLGNGEYDLGGQNVTVTGKSAQLADGTLAGSIVTLQEAAKNMMDFTSCGIREIIQMASVNPAKQINVFNRKGSIEKGKDADLVIWGQDGIEMTFCQGELAYQR